MRKTLARVYWHLPLPMSIKNRIRDLFPRNIDLDESNSVTHINSEKTSIYEEYIQQVLNTPIYRNKDYCEYQEHSSYKEVKLFAYYLTQYHPTEKNNLWWGKGTTEWTNVTKAVPQFLGHIQPRLPGDLGFYDLRLKDNIVEQVKIAKNYGISGFCFYFYWFNGERALEKPLDLFFNNKDIDIQYYLCWCNEDWTKRYNGINNEILLSVGKTEESYQRFIDDLMPYLDDKRYYCINGKKVITIYRPSLMPKPKATLQYWREQTRHFLGYDLYVIASQEAGIDIDWTKYGFDAISQFMPASINHKIKEENKQYNIIRSDFAGQIFNYKEIIDKRLYEQKQNSKVYPAVMPAWDNTPRRNNKGYIFTNSNPELFKRWVIDAIQYVNKNTALDDKLILINAWNEWGEGAYLEPDREYGYAYLEAIFKAQLETIEKQ